MSIITGDLPPSSKVRGVSCSAAALATSWPTAVLPVNNKWLKGRPAKYSEIVGPPWITLISVGLKYWDINVAKYPDVLGDLSEGFSQTLFPAAKAEIIGINDKFKG